MPTLLLDSVNCKMWTMLSRSLHLVGRIKCRNWDNIKEQIANTIDGSRLSVINFQKSDVDNVANRSQRGKIIATIYEVLKAW